jgi:hypothetical protein
MSQRPREKEPSKLGRFNETVATINSAVRTALATIVVGGVTVGTYYGYQTYYAKDLAIRRAAQDADQAAKERDEAKANLTKANEELQSKSQQIATLNLDLEAKLKQIQKLETSLALLKVDRRLARLNVVEQGEDAQTMEQFSDVEFTELSTDGNPLGQPRKFRIRGDVVYVDNWIVKFDDKYVEEADLERSTSLVLFRRIFGEKQQPADGFPLDEVGVRPQAYARGGQMSEFEKKIWGDFWNIANDEAKAKDLGIRAAHGEAVSIKVQKGKAYKMQLRASDGLSILPETPGG